jgi:hypothetical protein
MQQGEVGKLDPGSIMEGLPRKGSPSQFRP